MPHIRPILKTTLVSSFIAVLSGIGPMAAVSFAEDTCTPPTEGSGVHRPVGADANTYTYNCDNKDWENAHYIYNPTTGLVTAKDPVVYTYNASTGQYDYTTWVYSAPSGAYVQRTSSVTTPPAGATVVGGPAPASNSGSSISNTGPGSTNTIDNNGGNTSSTITGTGPNSTNTVGSSTGTNTTVNNGNVLSVNNGLQSQASSGNTLVLGNTTGGSATSGDATAIANAVNLLQSATNVFGLSGNVATFVANIDGDVNGDLLLDPSSLGTIQPANGNNNIDVTNSTDAAINNNINLAAQTGDATVASNTNGGNATTGSAQAIANVVNVINSAISGGQSFLGVININGNLNGDILMPPAFIDALIAANVPTVNINVPSSIGDTGPDSTNTIAGSNSNNTTVTNTNNQGTTNDVNATATSGTANVSHNSSAGNATTGSATTHITAFNLTGSTVVGKNDLLVFVNVLGKWVGMIVDAPAGATAAELGGGITTDSTGDNTATLANASNQTINNTINATAASGNASVTDNTKAGDATSGNANIAVNLLNINSSSFSLANWFGILFINVFGTWNGSFGVNTSAGDPVNTDANISNTGTGAALEHAVAALFGFHPASSKPKAATASYSIGDTGPGSTNTIVGTTLPSGTVLAAQTDKASKAPTPQLAKGSHNFWLPAGGLVIAVVLLGSERLTSRKKA